MRPLAKMARHVPPREVAFLPFHRCNQRFRKAAGGYTDSAASSVN
jgi:hypothetical protein